MKKGQSILVLSVLSVTIISLFAVAVAQERNVWTSDSPDPSAEPKDQFLPGETVYVHWENFLRGVLVVIKHETGIVDVQFHAEGNGVKAYVPNAGPGMYRVFVTDIVIYEFKVTTFYVIPEVLFGSLGAVGAASAAGLVYYRRKRR